MEQATEDSLSITHPATIVAILITSAALAVATLLLLGIDITPALTWPTTYVPGPGGDPNYLPPAR